jgi:hypothetical protein
MRYKLKTLTVCAILALSAQSYAVMLGLCINKNGTGNQQYICCPAKGGWIASNACDPGASEGCVADTGKIAGTDTPILQDCKNRGGDHMMYPMDK